MLDIKFIIDISVATMLKIKITHPIALYPFTLTISDSTSFVLSYCESFYAAKMF